MRPKAALPPPLSGELERCLAAAVAGNVGGGTVTPEALLAALAKDQGTARKVLDSLDVTWTVRPGLDVLTACGWHVLRLTAMPFFCAFLSALRTSCPA